MAHYSTISEFQSNHPRESEAIQCVFVSETGKIHQYIIPIEDWYKELKNLMTRYVFVNGRKSIVHTIKL